MLLKKVTSKILGYSVSYVSEKRLLFGKIFRIRKSYYSHKFLLGNTERVHGYEISHHGNIYDSKEYKIKNLQNGIVTREKKSSFSLNGKDHGSGYSVIGRKYTYFVGEEDRTRYRN